MSAVCPTCNSALDPAHAPVARVRGSKVVTYCSAACADNVIDEAMDASLDASSSVRETTPPKPGETQRGPQSNRKWVLAACALAMVAGGAFTIQQLRAQSAEDPSAVALVATQDPAAKVATTPTPTVTPLETKSAADLEPVAIAELESLLQTGSSKVQRLAAIALSRRKHPKAIETLRRLLKEEDSDLSRIDIAFGLLRAGDEKGREYLVEELSSSRRDVRIDAARRLAELGDNSGAKTLEQMLSVRSHRLGAAGVLALLGDEDGLKVLRETLDDSGETDENHMRAAVALGLAGEKVAREKLVGILENGKFVVDAAGALAVLKDERAIPALVRQLELSALRVGAVEHLLQLGAEVPLDVLRATLKQADEEGRIASAESILAITQKPKKESE